MKKLSLLVFLFTSVSFAAPNYFNFNGYLTDSGGQAQANVSGVIDIAIQDQVACVLYRETHSVTTDGTGDFSLKVGSGTTPTYFGGNSKFSQIFNSKNSAITGDGCTVNGLTASWHLSLKYNGTAMGTVALTAVPFASVAESAENADTLDGIDSTGFVLSSHTLWSQIIGGTYTAPNATTANSCTTATTATTATNVSGVVALANGGTGASTAAGARTNLGLGSLSTISTSGVATDVLRGDGTWSGLSTGTVTSVATGTGLTGGPIVTSGTISLANTSVSAGSYGDAANIANFTVDAQGRLTAANSVAIAPPWASITGKPTTLGGFGITDAIKNISGTPSIQSGVLSGRPAAGIAGRIFIASDTSLIYQDNGASWTVVGDGIGTGTVTNVSALSPLSSTGGATPQISLSQASSSVNGYLSSTDWTTFNNKLGSVLGSSLTSGQIWIGNASNQASAVTLSGDATLTNAGAVTVTQIQNRSVSSSTPTSGSYLKWNGISQWVPSSVMGTSCVMSTKALHYDVSTDTWYCDTVDLNTPNQALITNSSPSTHFTNGALVVSGGVGVAGDINSGAAVKASQFASSRTTASAGSEDSNNFTTIMQNSSTHTGLTRGLFSYLSSNSTAATINQAYASDAWYAHNSVNLIGEAVGSNTQVMNSSTGTISSASGVKTRVQASSGAITTAYGNQVDVAVASGGNINTAYGQKVSVFNGGTLNNSYGTYIDNPVAGATHYGLYVANGKSHFNGNVGIGTTNPVAALEVNGDIKVSKSIISAVDATSHTWSVAVTPQNIPIYSATNRAKYTATTGTGGYIGCLRTNAPPVEGMQKRLVLFKLSGPQNIFMYHNYLSCSPGSNDYPVIFSGETISAANVLYYAMDTTSYGSNSTYAVFDFTYFAAGTIDTGSPAGWYITSMY